MSQNSCYQNQWCVWDCYRDCSRAHTTNLLSSDGFGSLHILQRLASSYFALIFNDCSDDCDIKSERLKYVDPCSISSTFPDSLLCFSSIGCLQILVWWAHRADLIYCILWIFRYSLAWLFTQGALNQLWKALKDLYKTKPTRTEEREAIDESLYLTLDSAQRVSNLSSPHCRYKCWQPSIGSIQMFRVWVHTVNISQSE